MTFRMSIQYFYFIHFYSNNEDMIYNGCGNSKTCFGIPNNCIQTQSCVSFTAVKVEGMEMFA